MSSLLYAKHEMKKILHFSTEIGFPNFRCGVVRATRPSATAILLRDGHKIQPRP